MIDAGLWYIPQESSLFPYLSVADNLRLPLEGRRRQFGAGLEQRYAETLAHFPVLKEKLRERAGNLSGGQQKSLEFAKAYMVRPRVCLIDEPSRSEEHTSELQSLMRISYAVFCLKKK